VLALPLLACLLAPAQPSPWQGWLAAGEQALREQHFPEAGRYFDTALSEAETFPAGDLRINAVLAAQARLYRAWRPAQGEVRFRDLIDRWTRQRGADDPAVASALVALAALLHRDPPVAEDDARLTPLYARAQRIRAAAYGEDAPCLTETLERLAVYAALAGRDDDAVAAYARAIAIKEAAEERDTELAQLYYALADRQYAARRDADAAAAWERALPLFDAADPDGEQTVRTVTRLAWTYQRLGDAPRRAACWRRAAALRATRPPPGWEHVLALEALAQAEIALGTPAAAETALQQALALRRQYFPGTEAGTLVALAELSRTQHRLTTAADCYRRAADCYADLIRRTPDLAQRTELHTQREACLAQLRALDALLAPNGP